MVLEGRLLLHMLPLYGGVERRAECASTRAAYELTEVWVREVCLAAGQDQIAADREAKRAVAHWRFDENRGVGSYRQTQIRGTGKVLRLWYKEVAPRGRGAPTKRVLLPPAFQMTAEDLHDAERETYRVFRAIWERLPGEHKRLIGRIVREWGNVPAEG